MNFGGRMGIGRGVVTRGAGNRLAMGGVNRSVEVLLGRRFRFLSEGLRYHLVEVPLNPVNRQKAGREAQPNECPAACIDAVAN
jgi:hypothetical protein